MKAKNVVALAATSVLAAAVVAAANWPADSTISVPAAGAAKTQLAGVTLRPIAGGPHYYASINPDSAWLDRHILLGAWDEGPLSAQEVRYDVAMGNNIYWNLVSKPLGPKCSSACRVDFDVIEANGMHASAPDVTKKSGRETVAYEGTDEADMRYGPGADGWNPNGTAHNQSDCIPSGSQCGYTVAKFFYAGQPASYGSPGYPAGKKPVIQGYGKGVLFWETSVQAAQFLRYSSTLSADSYWLSDPSLALPSQGACALLSRSSPECGSSAGTGLSYKERALSANYAFDVTRIQALEALIHESRPIVVDIETGCPFTGQAHCTYPAAAVSAAWHALIAGARGIIWFQHNFSGPCIDFTTFYDGSNPRSSKYNCQQTPGVALHDVVKAVSAFNHKVIRLNNVLLSPFALNYVSVGNADVSVMAKHYNGTFYVFAASGKPAQPPARDLPVRFKLAGNYTGPVAVIDENRTLHADHGVFTDKFANSDAVHVYKIG